MPEVFLNGHCGRLEGRYNPADSNKIALVLHPHPLYGGTLHNKVVYQVAQTLRTNGYSVLRPNFRGVGRSEGSYDNAEGELYDAVDAFDWLQSRHDGFSSCVVAGFSFGAYIAIQLLMRRPEISWFAALSPPVNSFDMSFISPCPTPGLVIQGAKDEIVPPHQVEEFVEKLRTRSNHHVDFHLMPDADHFFTGQLESVCSLIDDFAKNKTKPASSTPASSPQDTKPDDASSATPSQP